MTEKRYGWIPDKPDPRDHQYQAPPDILVRLPLSVDLRPRCPPVYDQGDLNSCTANAIAGAVQFDLIKQKETNFVPSRLFLYFNERTMAGNLNRDTGAPIRDGIKCIAQYGDCHEPLWPYAASMFAQKPPKECYAQARKYRAIKYQRLSQRSEQLKCCLASGYPFVFGIKVFAGFEGSSTQKTGHVSMPTKRQKPKGNHAVLAVGYDDSKELFIVRNSWGDKWGMNGYFTLPYSYALDRSLASDLWTIHVIT